MSGEDKTRHMAVGERQRRADSGNGAHDGERAEHLTRSQIDEEIAAMEERSRHQTQTLTPRPGTSSRSPRKALLMIGVALLILLAAGAVTLIGRETHERALAKETERSTDPTVAIVHPLAGNPDEELVLPGSLPSVRKIPIYAPKTGKILVGWYKDIGSRVKEGDLLATIDTPLRNQSGTESDPRPHQRWWLSWTRPDQRGRWENLRQSDSVSRRGTVRRRAPGGTGKPSVPPMPNAPPRRSSFNGCMSSTAYAPEECDPGALTTMPEPAPPAKCSDMAHMIPAHIHQRSPVLCASYSWAGEPTVTACRNFRDRNLPPESLARTADQSTNHTHVAQPKMKCRQGTAPVPDPSKIRSP